MFTGAQGHQGPSSTPHSPSTASPDAQTPSHPEGPHRKQRRETEDLGSLVTWRKVPFPLDLGHLICRLELTPLHPPP